MNLEDLKTDYANTNQELISRNALNSMLQMNKQPVLRGIRIQMVIESIAWVVFLGFYYDFFDGHLRPLLWNILLVSSVGFLLVHNLLGQIITNNPIDGFNLKDSLQNYLIRIRRYAYLSVAARSIAFVILFGYFTSTLEFFETRHYWSLVALVLLISVQVYMLWAVWLHRIRVIASKYQQLMD